MSIAIIDNFDSFTFNLRELLYQCSAECDVFKNEDITDNLLRRYRRVIISPGPGLPSESGKLTEVLRSIASCTSILGICLGHQALAENFGAELIRLNFPRHGVRIRAKIHDPTDPLFAGVPTETEVGLYHSWSVSPATLPEDLRVLASDSENNILAIKHRNYPLYGVQFHPESIMTPDGRRILQNWLSIA